MYLRLERNSRRNRRKRNDLEITADILKVALHGARKTHIVYKANLNFKILNEYLTRMNGMGLIANEQSKIKTTEKGLEYIKHYNNFMKYVESSPPSP